VRLAKAEDYESKDFMIRETELESEKAERMAEKKKKFLEEFKPDFDLDEVPPLE
jgi:type IV secretory pathway VirD2 relaxase